MIVHQAVSADSFIDTIGINVHLHYTDTVYNQFDTIIKPSLLDLGVRHVRDGAKTYAGINADSFYYQRVRALAAEGIKFNFITSSLDTSWGDPTNYDLLDEVYLWSNGAVSAFEAVNEPDLQGVESWIPATLSGQEQLYNTVNNHPDLQHVPVVGPSIVNPWNNDLVGDLSDLLDFGNIHNYFSSRHPETPGWGDGGYGSLGWHFEQAAKISGEDPIMSTETGWHNAVDAEGNYVGVPQDIEAIYVPRLFLTHFNAGITRTFLYELIDVHNRPTQHDANFGLLNNDGTPQPAYYALDNLIERLADPGPAFTPTPLTFDLQGQTSDVDYTLLQKRDGAYFLAIWLGKSSWNPDSKNRIDVPAQSVTLTLPPGFTTATLHRFGADGLVQESTATLTNGQLTLAVEDTVTLVELPPLQAYIPRDELPPLASDSLTNLEGNPTLVTSVSGLQPSPEADLLLAATSPSDPTHTPDVESSAWGSSVSDPAAQVNEFGISGTLSPGSPIGTPPFGGDGVSPGAAIPSPGPDQSASLV